MRRLLPVVVSVLAVVLSMGPAGAHAPADSAQHTVAQHTMAQHTASRAQWHKVKRPYTHNWVFRSTKLHRCVFFQVSGSIAGKWRYAYGPDTPDHDTLEWADIRLLNPTVEASGWPIGGAGCDSTRSWKMRAELSQGWYQTSCDLDVSVSVGYPWSVSASPEYSCGEGRVGHRTSSEGPSKKRLYQYNSGAPIHFSGGLGSVKSRRDRLPRCRVGACAHRPRLRPGPQDRERLPQQVTPPEARLVGRTTGER